MTDIQLQELQIANFRSIKGSVHAPLDAKVVLVHGENGSGKTSLLAAIEIALTGLVASLRRADPNYRAQLLHRGAAGGLIELRTLGLPDTNRFKTLLTKTGIEQIGTLPVGLASFFSERCYLPQSLLGQLLQIYQELGFRSDSPLSRFVNELLGLDRLDAIETGLLPVGDIRNLRKTTDRYGQIEYEKTRLERTLAEHRGNRDTAAKAIAEALVELNRAVMQLGTSDSVGESSLDSVDERLVGQPEEQQLNALADQRRLVVAVQREAARSATASSQQDEASLADAHRQANSALQDWRRQFESVFALLRERITKLAPDAVLSQTDPEALHRDALLLLRAAKQRAIDRTTRAVQDVKRDTEVAAELVVARKNLATIDTEISRIAASAGNLATALAELSAFVTNDVCPVCDRDFAELGNGPLAEHVNHKVRVLSGSAARLLGLSKNRGDQQILIERLERDAAELQARKLDPKAIVALEREAADLDVLVSELDQLADAAREGARLAAAETTARRALAEHQSLDLARTATMATLTELAQTLGLATPEAIATPQAAIEDLLVTLDQQTAALNARASGRRTAGEVLRRIRVEIARRQSLDTLIEGDLAAYRRVEAALARANAIRTDAQHIRAQVEAVRSRIISREFNDRLNRLWRDLFLRLAPHEPFVPAFKIPTEFDPSPSAQADHDSSFGQCRRHTGRNAQRGQSEYRGAYAVHRAAPDRISSTAMVGSG